MLRGFKICTVHGSFCVLCFAQTQSLFPGQLKGVSSQSQRVVALFSLCPSVCVCVDAITQLNLRSPITSVAGSLIHAFNAHWS